MSLSLTDTILRNTGYNFIGRIWGFALNLVLTPYIVNQLGIDRFGIWSLLNVITGYFGLVDLGVSKAYVKFVAEYYIQRKTDRISEVIVTGIFFYTFVSGIILVVAWFAVDFLMEILAIPPALQKETRTVFFLTLIFFSFTSILQIFRELILGVQRMDWYNIVSIIASIPLFIGSVFVLSRGYGLVGLVYVQGLIGSINAVVFIILSYRLIPGLNLSGRYLSWSELSKMLSYGVKITVGRLEDVFTFQSDKMIIAHFLSVSLVGAYQIGSTIINWVREIPLLLVSAILPVAAGMSVQGNNEQIRLLYRQGTKYIALVTFPLLGFTFVTAPLILRVWMDKIYPESVQVILILAGCYMVNIISGLGNTIALGIGRPDLRVKAGLFQVICNLVLSILFVLKIGFPGVIWGTFVSLTLSSLWFMFTFHRLIGISTRILFKETILIPLLYSLFLTVLLFYFNDLFLHNFKLTRMGCLVYLMGEGILFCLLGWWIFTGRRFFLPEEKNVLTSFILRTLKKGTT